MNIEVFNEVANLIELEGRFNLSTWASYHGPVPYEMLAEEIDLINNCRTIGCVGGWVCARFGTGMQLWDEDFAVETLGITDEQAAQLFYADANTIWARLADRFGWKTGTDGLEDWADITAVEAAKVLREIANGQIKFTDSEDQ